MKQSLKKSCKGCRGLRTAHGETKCVFGVAIGVAKTIGGRAVEYRPLAECMKPKTVEEFEELTNFGDCDICGKKLTKYHLSSGTVKVCSFKCADEYNLSKDLKNEKN